MTAFTHPYIAATIYRDGSVRRSTMSYRSTAAKAEADREREGLARVYCRVPGHGDRLFDPSELGESVLIALTDRAWREYEAANIDLRNARGGAQVRAKDYRKAISLSDRLEAAHEDLKAARAREQELLGRWTMADVFRRRREALYPDYDPEGYLPPRTAAELRAL